MPPFDQILAGLTAIANDWRGLAIFWHLYFAVLALLVMRAAIPHRLTGILLGVPLLSVSTLAWLAGNPFNGTVFLIAGTALIVIGAQLPPARSRSVPLASIIGGAVLFAFGWVYPHFLNTPSLLPYLYAAPTGLIPCPTLSIVVGLALATGGLGSRSWSLVLAAVSAFYGLFGAFILGVTIDLVLTAGALMLFGVALQTGESPRARSSLS